MEYTLWVGKQVRKCGNRAGANVKPFKSGNMVNTVKGVINHPQLNVPAFTFTDDDSYVACNRCLLVGE